MSDVRLGSLVDGSAERDAIHVAVVPVVASEMLRPGQRVGKVAGNELALHPQCWASWTPT